MEVQGVGTKSLPGIPDDDEVKEQHTQRMYCTEGAWEVPVPV